MEYFADLIKAKTQLLKLIQVRSAPLDEKEELMISWCQLEKEMAMRAYFFCSDEELQEELMAIDELMNRMLSKIELTELANIIKPK